MEKLGSVQAAGGAVGDHRSEDAPRRERRHVGGPLLLLLVLAVVVFALVAVRSSADSGVTLTEGEFGAAWPLTVTEGVLRCEQGDEITFRSRGTTYTVSRSTEHGENSNDIAPIWGQGAPA